MSSKAAKWLAIVLAVVIIVLAWFLFTTPAHAPVAPVQQPTNTTTASTTPPAASATSTQAAQVTVTAPAANATVGHSFEIAGTAPGAWFFEAVFPIQVRDPNDNLIGTAQAAAQGDWQTAGLVTFTSQVNIDASYEGPATLILAKDNPSGLPQNEDSVTVPIIVQ